MSYKCLIQNTAFALSNGFFRNCACLKPPYSTISILKGHVTNKHTDNVPIDFCAKHYNYVEKDRLSYVPSYLISLVQFHLKNS